MVSCAVCFDMPDMNEGKTHAYVLQSSRRSYSNILGGFGVSDSAVAHEDLLAKSIKEPKISPQSRISANVRSGGQNSDSPRFSEDTKSSLDFVFESFHDAKQRGVSYQKPNQETKQVANGTTQMDKVNKLGSNNVDCQSPAASETEESKSVTPEGDGGSCSPVHFGEEADANSVAAVSAAAVRDAIDKAQARIKTAKQLMVRKKNALQNRAKVSFDDLKTEKWDIKVKKFKEHQSFVEIVTKLSSELKECANKLNSIPEVHEMKENKEKLGFAYELAEPRKKVKALNEEQRYVNNLKELKNGLKNGNQSATLKVKGVICLEEPKGVEGRAENEKKLGESCKQGLSNRTTNSEMEDKERTKNGMSLSNMISKSQKKAYMRTEYVEKQEAALELNKNKKEENEGHWKPRTNHIRSMSRRVKGVRHGVYHNGEKIKSTAEMREKATSRIDQSTANETEIDCHENSIFEKSSYDLCKKDHFIELSLGEENAAETAEVLACEAPLQLKGNKEELQASTHAYNQVEKNFESDHKVQEPIEASEAEKHLQDATEVFVIYKSNSYFGRSYRNFGRKHNLKETETVSNPGEQTEVPSDKLGKGEKDVKASQPSSTEDDDKKSYNVEKHLDNGTNVEVSELSSTLLRKENTEETETIQMSPSEKENHQTALATDKKDAEKTLQNEMELEKRDCNRMGDEKEKGRAKEKIVVERAIREARERAFAEVRERAAVERAAGEARKKATADAREKSKRTFTYVNDKSSAEKAAMEAKLKVERAAVERATAEARERALEKALSGKAKARGYDENVAAEKVSSASVNDSQSKASGSSSSSSFPNQGAKGECAHQSKARLERDQRTAERADRAAQALEEKNKRDLLAQKEQAERSRLAEALDAEVKLWSSGKEGNLRALLSTLQYILGSESGWKPISLIDMISTTSVKKAYRKATLIVHPDKLQQRGASIQQKYTCEKVFDLLKEAYNKIGAERS